jgi:glutamyl-tRNA synthetase
MERVHKGGAKFDFEKAKWFNHEWIKKMPVAGYRSSVKSYLEEKGLVINDEAYLDKVMTLVKDRCTLLTDFYEQSKFLFETPTQLDVDSVKPKWNDDKKAFFEAASNELQAAGVWKAAELETSFKALATQKNIKPGEVLLPLRVMLVGGKFGPGVFDIAELIGKEETVKRIANALAQL